MRWKIHRLPPEKVAEVEGFARRGDRRLSSAATKLSERVFRRVWRNPSDAAYDRP